jgi:DNA gyrase subunit A
MAENEPHSSIVPVRIEDEMRSSYMEYAMSVIVGRALPDVRDGLKPVHRRILYAMYEQSNSYNRAHKKSARIVGDVIGKYHPHGDSAVYDALVRMAQDFSMRMPLVDGQGNFGSIDGDPAAAMRYTEVRMTRPTSFMLSDIEKETVDFGPNYDGSEHEPLVLPTRIPNLLINGAEGIAVGMATRIPPHNLTEVVSGAIALIDNPELTVHELMEYIPGPDFPTAGSIHGLSGIRDAYETGRGKVKIRAKTEVEIDDRTQKPSIIVHELPYQVNKARLLEKIAKLVRDKKVDGITDLRDESDRTGMRMVIELRRDSIPQIVLNHLFKKTQLETTFGIHMLAIVAGQPQCLPLKQVLSHFIDFRRDVVTRRCLYELRKAQERLHILHALRKAVDMIDEVIETIRGSDDVPAARQALMDLLDIDEGQSQAILDMRLQSLTSLQINKLLDEIGEVEGQIERLETILGDETELLAVIRQELEEVRDLFGDPRRTEIHPDEGEISLEDLIEDKDEVVMLTHTGYIKRTPLSEYRMQKRGGKGLRGMDTKDEDVIEDIWVTNTHASLLIFTSAGKVYRLMVHEIPSGGRNARGKPVVNLIPVEQDEKVQAIVPFEEFDEDRYIITATRKGKVKKTQLDLFQNVHAGGIIGVKLVEGDELINARLCEKGDHILLVSFDGQSIRFDQEEVRPMGRATMGVRGINLRDDDEVVSMVILKREKILESNMMVGEEPEPIDEIDEEELEEALDDDEIESPRPGAHRVGCQTIVSITENGYGKRTRFEEHRTQGRGGYGIIAIKTSERNGGIARVRIVEDDDQLILISDGGQIIRTRADQISVLSRNTQGVRLMRLAEDESVVGVARFSERDDEDFDEDDEESEGQDAESADESGDGGEAEPDTDTSEEESSDDE